MAYKDKEKERLYYKEYHIRNKLKKKKQKAERYQKIKEYQKEWSRKKYQSNKEFYKNRTKIYNCKISARYGILRRGSPKRGYDMTLTFEEFKNIVSKSCKYCGENIKIIGIDRIDNNIGYILENCVPCCKICNIMKSTLSLEEFISHIKKIHKLVA